ncbi:MAG: tyrosine-type recombinase/integrase [Lachnospiraceae bacterium]|nr:tyrosine-type recombinase/integrase [Lachnospiraceae bacterium]
MNLLQSDKTYEELIQHMERCGYSPFHIQRVNRETKWLSEHKEMLASYEEACILRSSETESADMKQQFRAVYSLFRRYAIYGTLSVPIREPLFRQDTYSKLSPYFQHILDLYREDSVARGLKPGTYLSGISACSGLLLHCQKRGCKTLEDITEDTVLSYFCDESGKPILSSSTKVNIASVFHADLGMHTDAARAILAYLPALNRRRKNIQYLTEEEILSIKNVLMSEEDCITLRNRAIGMLLFFTGMRSSDIAGLAFSDIDGEKEEIRVFQKKTGNELVLPLTVSIGNAIYDYVTMERPQSDSQRIFLCEQAPYKPISAGTVGNAADRLFEAASVRQGKQDRKGAHLFRHNVATSFSRKDIPRPVISATLGHVDPDSLDHYLFADIEHLRGCAVSIEGYPVREGVFTL